jgi:hypothetical protein
LITLLYSGALAYRSRAAIGVLLYSAVAVGAWSAGADWDQLEGLSTLYLLLLNLVVLWWYADRTHHLTETVGRQYSFAVQQFVIANKPIVFLESEQEQAGGAVASGIVRLVARNVGPGIAINVHVLAHHVDGRWDRDAIGALEAGGRRVLPASVDARLELEAHAG